MFKAKVTALVVSMSKSPSALVSMPMWMTVEICSLLAPVNFAASAHEAATSAAADAIAACIFLCSSFPRPVIIVLFALVDSDWLLPTICATAVASLATERAACI